MGLASLSNQYARPLGYKVARLIAGASKYLPFNGFVSGGMNYAPNVVTAKIVNLTFSAAPTDGSTLTIQDGPPTNPGAPNRVFAFTYGGSPGAGIIPLVSGGGTAAQAAAATQLALAAQLTNWTVTIPVGAPLVVLLVAKNRGFNPTVVNSDVTHIAKGESGSTQNPVIPGRAGRIGGFFPG